MANGNQTNTSTADAGSDTLDEDIREEDVGPDVDDGERYIVIDGDPETRETCTEVCAAEGLECDDTHEHFLLGSGGTLSEYGGWEGKDDCDHELVASFEDMPGQDIELNWYLCYCIMPED